MYRYSYISLKGMRRSNQDALLIQTAHFQERELLIAAVCDGMGGLSCGEHASSYTVFSLSEWFSGDFAKMTEENSSVLVIRAALDDFLHSVNDDINRAGETEGDMGTTCTAMLIDPEKNFLLAAHVGDTRLYQITDDTITLLTTDHSVIAEELRRGIISEATARTDTRQNQITNCIGAGETGREYDYSILAPQSGCVYLLCSDGFRKVISEAEIQRALAPSANPDSDALQQHLSALGELNLERGETDNISAAAVKYIKEN